MPHQSDEPEDNNRYVLAIIGTTAGLLTALADLLEAAHQLLQIFF